MQTCNQAGLFKILQRTSKFQTRQFHNQHSSFIDLTARSLRLTLLSGYKNSIVPLAYRRRTPPDTRPTILPLLHGLLIRILDCYIIWVRVRIESRRPSSTSWRSRARSSTWWWTRWWWGGGGLIWLWVIVRVRIRVGWWWWWGAVQREKRYTIHYWRTLIDDSEGTYVFFLVFRSLWSFFASSLLRSASFSARILSAIPFLR